MTISIHFITTDGDLEFKQYVNNVPRVGDEIRVGGPGSEQYYKVEHVIWVYDEPENPLERVNVGISKI